MWIASFKHIIIFSLRYICIKTLVKFMYFWLNYSDRNSHLERLLNEVQILTNVIHIFCMASGLLESDELHLFLISDSSQTD